MASPRRRVRLEARRESIPHEIKCTDEEWEKLDERQQEQVKKCLNERGSSPASEKVRKLLNGRSGNSGRFAVRALELGGSKVVLKARQDVGHGSAVVLKVKRNDDGQDASPTGNSRAEKPAREIRLEDRGSRNNACEERRSRPQGRRASDPAKADGGQRQWAPAVMSPRKSPRRDGPRSQRQHRHQRDIGSSPATLAPNNAEAPKRAASRKRGTKRAAPDGEKPERSGRHKSRRRRRNEVDGRADEGGKPPAAKKAAEEKLRRAASPPVVEEEKRRAASSPLAARRADGTPIPQGSRPKAKPKKQPLPHEAPVRLVQTRSASATARKSLLNEHASPTRGARDTGRRRDRRRECDKRSRSRSQAGNHQQPLPAGRKERARSREATEPAASQKRAPGEHRGDAEDGRQRHRRHGHSQQDQGARKPERDDKHVEWDHWRRVATPGVEASPAHRGKEGSPARRRKEQKPPAPARRGGDGSGRKQRAPSLKRSPSLKRPVASTPSSSPDRTATPPIELKEADEIAPPEQEVAAKSDGGTISAPGELASPDVAAEEVSEDAPDHIGLLASEGSDVDSEGSAGGLAAIAKVELEMERRCAAVVTQAAPIPPQTQPQVQTTELVAQAELAPQEICEDDDSYSDSESCADMPTDEQPVQAAVAPLVSTAVSASCSGSASESPSPAQEPVQNEQPSVVNALVTTEAPAIASEHAVGGAVSGSASGSYSSSESPSRSPPRVATESAPPQVVSVTPPQGAPQVPPAVLPAQVPPIAMESGRSSSSSSSASSSSSSASPPPTAPPMQPREAPKVGQQAVEGRRHRRREPASVSRSRSKNRERRRKHVRRRRREPEMSGHAASVPPGGPPPHGGHPVLPPGSMPPARGSMPNMGAVPVRSPAPQPPGYWGPGSPAGLQPPPGWPPAGHAPPPGGFGAGYPPPGWGPPQPPWPRGPPSGAPAHQPPPGWPPHGMHPPHMAAPPPMWRMPPMARPM